MFLEPITAPRTAAGGGTGHFRDQAGKAHQVLTGRTDTDDLDFRIRQLLLDRLLGFKGVFAPQAGCIPNLDCVVS
jgi:hypothetical protein